MTDLQAAAQQALEALDTLYRTLTPETPLAKSLKQRADDLRAALKSPEQEPVEWLHINGTSDTKWYPPQRPAEPVGWLRAIDEALVIHHCGVMDPLDDYQTAKDKLNNLMCCVQDIATYFVKEQSPEECK